MLCPYWVPRAGGVCRLLRCFPMPRRWLCPYWTPQGGGLCRLGHRLLAARSDGLGLCVRRIWLRAPQGGELSRLPVLVCTAPLTGWLAVCFGVYA